jgi:hypothetical protein
LPSSTGTQGPPPAPPLPELAALLEEVAPPAPPAPPVDELVVVAPPLPPPLDDEDVVAAFVSGALLQPNTWARSPTNKIATVRDRFIEVLRKEMPPTHGP